MPQLIALAVAGAGLYAGYKWLQRKAAAHAETVATAQARPTPPTPKEMGHLEWDAEAQAYRPARR